MKILLDPLLYWFHNSPNNEVNLSYLNKVTSIIENYFDIKYVSSKNFIQILQRLNKEPFSTTSKPQSDMRKAIIKRLMENLDYPNNISNINCDVFKFPDNFNTTEYDELNEHFARIVNYLYSSDIPCLLILAVCNFKSYIKSHRQLFIVKNISGEVDSKITEFISNNQFLKENLPQPNLLDPLPFSDLCDNFYSLQENMCKEEDDISVFWRITKEVALRNMYSYDQNVTSKNNSDNHKRKIYTYNKKHYISADFESGCFELCDHKGKHKGEISYIGVKLSPPDKTGCHDINV